MFSKNNDRADSGQVKSSAAATDTEPVVTLQLQRRRFRLARREIGYLRFLLEGYDGLGFVRTLDAAAAVVEIAWPASQAEVMEGLLVELTRELAMTVVSTEAPGL